MDLRTCATRNISDIHWVSYVVSPRRPKELDLGDLDDKPEYIQWKEFRILKR